jgi:RNA-directed DNA polymerase
VQEVVALINPKIRGWVNYFRHGNSSHHFKLLRDWIEKKVRRHLLKQKQQRGFGWKRWSRKALYQRYGLYKDYQIRYSVPPKVKPA